MNMSTHVHDTVTKNFSRRLTSYQLLDQYDAIRNNDPLDIGPPIGYKNARAKQRQVFLKSYRLASTSKLRRRRLRSLKLKKVVLKMRLAVMSILSFMRSGSALRSCNSRSAISACSPAQVSKSC